MKSKKMISSILSNYIRKNCSNSNDICWDVIVNTILGFQNEEHNYAIQIELCNKNYTPGTFTIGEITKDSRFLENPIDFKDWITNAIKDEIDLIKKYYPHFYNPKNFQNITPKIVAILEKSPENSIPLKNQIWYQEYPDIIRRLILLITIGNPDQELDVYPHLKKNRSRFIFDVIDFLEKQKFELKDWLHLSIAAGLLGIDEKSVHAATSAINTHMAIKLPSPTNYSQFDIERVSRDLIRTAQSECRIDAANRFFHLMDSNQFLDFCIVSLPDDYLETIFLLKYYEKLLTKYSKLNIFCIPKSKICGNDATYSDIQDFLEKMPILKNIGRFHLAIDGPIIGGCNLLKSSKNVSNIIKKSQLIDVRGARNYEMMQGVNKEIYFGFMVCREISESVTGLPANKLPFIYIRQPMGEKTFEGFKERYKRIEDGKMRSLKTVIDNKSKWE